MQNQHKRFVLFLVSSLVIISVAFYLSLTSGSYELSINQTFRTLFRLDVDARQDLIIFDFRLPRIVLGALVGMGLGIAGAVLQGITRNPLADPGILGINAGAGAAVVCFLFLVQGSLIDINWLSIFVMPIVGWVGGMLAVVLLLVFATERGRLDPQIFILTGIAISAGFGALTLFVSLKMNPRDYEMAAVWLAGSVYSTNWKHVLITLPWILILTPFIVYKARKLDVLGLSEISATGLGLSVTKERYTLIFLSVGLIAACVSVAGSIAFVGLIAPHVARRLVGIHHRFVLPASGILGVIIVMIADWIAKTIFAPAQLPVGVVISIIGVPYFIFLLFQSKRNAKST